MFAINPIDNALDSLDTGINTASNNMQTNLDQLTQEAQNGTINPGTLLQVQQQMSIYTTFMTMCNSMVKSYGDIDKNIAQSIGG
jgi:type III secretion apparatus needle protein